MKLTKYEHACLVFDERGNKLIIDPGIFSKSFPIVKDVVGVVITHVHQDHLDLGKLEKIFADNPEAKLYTVEAVSDELKGRFSPIIVNGGEKVEVGPFNLEFFGGLHALIHKTYPRIENVGIMVNSKVYYPGDSFINPEKPVEFLAVPASAPWMRVGEAMDFVTTLKPANVFPTHDAILSDVGAAIHYRLLDSAAQTAGSQFQVLKTDEAITI